MHQTRKIQPTAKNWCTNGPKYTVYLWLYFWSSSHACAVCRGQKRFHAVVQEVGQSVREL